MFFSKKKKLSQPKRVKPISRNLPDNEATLQMKQNEFLDWLSDFQTKNARNKPQK